MNCILIPAPIFCLLDLIKDTKMKTNNIFLLFLSNLILGGGNSLEQKQNTADKEINIPNLEISKQELILNGNEGNWYYNNQLFNGYLVSHDEEGNLEQKVGFYNGKKEGISKSWFANGQLKVESHYHQNKLVASYKAWWMNGILASEATYENGVLQGLEKKWYNSGQLAKQMQYTDGEEVGMQQAWLQNGKLYVNYEARNGRIFGMKKANLCYQLEDEFVIRDVWSEATFGDNKK